MCISGLVHTHVLNGTTGKIWSLYVFFHKEVHIWSWPLTFLSSGFPLWLHFIPGIQFRTDNKPFEVIIPFLSPYLILLHLLPSITWNWIVFRQKCSGSLLRLWIWWSKRTSMHHREDQLFCLRFFLNFNKCIHWWKSSIDRRSRILNRLLHTF